MFFTWAIPDGFPENSYQKLVILCICRRRDRGHTCGGGGRRRRVRQQLKVWVVLRLCCLEGCTKGRGSALRNTELPKERRAERLHDPQNLLEMLSVIQYLSSHDYSWPLLHPLFSLSLFTGSRMEETNLQANANVLRGWWEAICGAECFHFYSTKHYH